MQLAQKGIHVCNRIIIGKIKPHSEEAQLLYQQGPFLTILPLKVPYQYVSGTSEKSNPIQFPTFIMIS